MLDLLTKLKKMVVEPKVYSMLVKSVHASLLHVGVHFSWEDAYVAASKRLNTIAVHKTGEQIDVEYWNSMTVRDVIVQAFDPNKVIQDAKSILPDPPNPFAHIPPVIMGHGNIADLIKSLMEFGESKNSLPKLIKIPDMLLDPLPPLETIQDHVDDVKGAKNELLNKLISTGDPLEVEKLGKLITTNEKKYVLKKIAEKAPKNPTSEPKEAPKG